MKIAGVITEYNPFHNGHKYQLEEIRKRTNADHIIVAMSGNFLQRGVPAIVDKYTRAEFALSNGADLCLEIPSLYSCASAEYFASAGVKLLGATGVVDTLCFGAETNDLALLKSIADIIIDEPEEYKMPLRAALKEGKPYPIARSEALIKCGYLKIHDITKDISQILDAPNNILAIEYLKALRYHNSYRKKLSSQKTPASINPCLIQRIGDGYHDKDFSSHFASATAIREKLLYGNKDLSTYLPDSVLAGLKEYDENHGLISEDSISQMLAYKLLMQKKEGFSCFADCNDEISNRMIKNINEYRSFTDFTELLKSKNTTYTRISRCLLHILLNHTKNDYERGKNIGMIPYIRVLGFKRSSSELLSEIKKNSSVPILTKLADSKNTLDKDALWMLDKDLSASDIYAQLISFNGKNTIKNDFSHKLIIM